MDAFLLLLSVVIDNIQYNETLPSYTRLPRGEWYKVLYMVTKTQVLTR